MSEEMRRMVPPEQFETHYRQLSFRTSFQNCVLMALERRGWRQTEGTNWNLQWGEKERVNDVFEEGLAAHQRTNHFRLWSQLCKKDMLIKNIRKHKRELQKQKLLMEEQWDFLPLTFFLPSQYIMFAEEFRKKGGLWIMKPTSRCQGQGIFIVDKLSQVAPFRHKSGPQPTVPPRPPPKPKKEEVKPNTTSEVDVEEEEKEEPQGDAVPESYLIQEYISRPLLFGSKKFDLRIYCLVTNYSQLTAWLYRSGFARFTHEPYSPERIDNLESHLTNVQIQKQSENYDEVRGGKWLLSRFKAYLLSRYPPSRVDWCFTEIKDTILRSLQAVQKNILPSRNSFELYGYDFMLDQSLKPWLIEVNGGPSMTANTPFDCRLKCGLVDDVFSILDLEGVLPSDQMSVGGFDLIVSKGAKVVQSAHSHYSCFLGTKNERVKSIRHLVRKGLKEREKENAAVPEEEKGGRKRGRVEAQGREKLLPDFYYKKKYQAVDPEARDTLRHQLALLADREESAFQPLSLIQK